MKLGRRILAITMTVLMLISMIPSTALANAICDKCTWGKWKTENGGPMSCGYVRTYRKCKVCGNTEYKEDFYDHEWGKWKVVKKATHCESWDGLKERKCKICGEKAQDEINGDHKWGKWKTVKKATCTEKGKRERTCTICGEKQKDSISKADHEWGKWKTTKEATCTEKGQKERKCSVCGKKDTETIPAGAHKWGAWVVIQEPDPSGQVGIRERKCSLCGKTQREEFYPDGTLKKGDKGDDVRDLQEKLNEQGHDCGTADGDFGKKTEAAVKEWQEANGYTPDGIIWPGQKDDLLSDDNGEAKLAVYLTILNGPANGSHYVLGETADFDITVENISNVPISNIKVSFVDDAGPKVWANWNLEPGESEAFDGVYEINEINVANGFYSAFAYAEGVTGDGEVVTAESDAIWLTCGADENADFQRVTVEKSITSTPANGEYYVPGETISFLIKVVIPEGKTITDLEVTDPLKGSNEDATLDILPTATSADNTEYVFDYVVTMEDGLRGYVENSACAYFFDPEGDAWVEEWSETVTAACGYTYYDGIFGETALAGIEVSKSVISAPANGQYYVPGETVCYTMDVKNTGSLPLESVTVRDSMYSSTDPVAIFPVDMEPGDTVSASFGYRVTEMDAISGSIKNIAQVVGYDPEGRAQVGLSNEVEVLTGMEGDFPFGVITEMTIVKEETSAPANGTHYTEGETISYKITYTNSGETDFGETLIYDTLKNDGVEIASAETLTAGESRYCTFSYVVTGNDVAKGYVANTAIAKYSIGGGYTNTAVSNVVVSDTDGDPNTTYVPGGKIDWQTLRGTEDAVEDTCYLKAVSRDGDSIEYEVHFCTEHAQIQNSILTMANAADTDAKKQMVWEYAYGLWQQEINSMYEEILPACDDAAKITVMSERMTHLSMVANTHFTMKIAEPGQPVETARAVAELWQDKCIDLCYLMNTAPSERVDSIFAVERALNEAESYETCSCVITEEAEGKILFADQYCPAHGFTYEMMELLLLTENSVENWATVRSLWEIELNKVYNVLYEDASEEGGMAYLVEYAAYLAWLPAYEQCLNMVYPENPQIVAEVMVNTIMNRALDACGRK